MTERRCPACGETKPTTEFVKNRSTKNGLASYCKACFAARHRANYEANPEQHRAIARRWYASNPEKSRRINRTRLLRSYGLELHEYERLHATQDGCCAVCGKAEADCPKGRLFVDHDHETGKIRGLLCSQCNFAVGLLDENPEVVQRLAAYLETHRTPTLEVVE